ncbi:MAG TPA: hypothetical protein VFV50_17385 [Bdellovibrionales bacterium]|nr:hypothetical protein [Bdellovibrionales bacterium]
MVWLARLGAACAVALPLAGAAHEDLGARGRIVWLTYGSAGASLSRDVVAAMGTACEARGGCDFELDTDKKRNWIPRLPEWIQIFDTSASTGIRKPAGLEALGPSFCRRPGWKIVLGHRPVYSSGFSGASLALAARDDGRLQECGVHVYVSGGDRHQEHLTAGTFEAVVQGAASGYRGVDQIQFKPGDPVKQRFARSQRGFSIFESTREKIELRFYNENATEIYKWSAAPDQIGLPKFVPTGP